MKIGNLLNAQQAAPKRMKTQSIRQRTYASPLWNSGFLEVARVLRPFDHVLRVNANVLTAIDRLSTLGTMVTKFFALIAAIGLANACVVQAQSPTPSASPAKSASSTKHRTESTHPFAAWPKARHAQRHPQTKGKAATAASPSPTASPSKH
jgi:hypothetical protein